MPILTNNNIFLLNTKTYQYAMGVGSDNLLHHLHWGNQVPIEDYDVLVYDEQNSNHGSLDFMNLEYTPFGGTMYRDCAIKCAFSDNTRDTVLLYHNYNIEKNILKITLKDPYYGLSVILVYTVDEDNDVITRNAVIENNGDSAFYLERAFSAEFSFPSRRDYTVYNDNGTWFGENYTKKQVLSCGTVTFESRKGTSSHSNTPYFIIAQDECEDSGKVFFATLEYSGNFKVAVSKDGFGITRAVIGLNDFDFSHTLKPGEFLETPKVHYGFARSLSEMSNNINAFAIDNIFPHQFADKPLDVLYNSWEATSFDVNTDNQKALADKAKAVGAELFVVDDGWFGARNDDWAGLGDWYVNTNKFPNGLDELIDYVNSLGMSFGLWLEPEMVNANSDLYRAHPDWTYHYDTRTPSELRHQRVLNLTKPEVEQYVFNCFDKLLTKYNISYIKWDMNRPFSEIGAENLENPKMLWLLHTKALYRIVDALKEKYSNVQFEACCGGGGRCDWGSFKHFDQIWTSDNTDAVDRITIQRGYSFINPTRAMRAWVTDTGNAPMDFKCNIAMQGSLGIGCDLTKVSEQDFNVIKSNVSLYKQYRNVIQFGNHYRVMNLNDDELNVIQYVDKAKNNSIVFITTPGTQFMHHYFNICLKGLNEKKRYLINLNGDTMVKSGAYLMYNGIEKKYWGKFINEIWTLTLQED